MSQTRTSSNIRPTTRECVHFVTRSHFRSPDKDGGHTIRSVIAKTPCCTLTSRLLHVIEAELLPIEVLHCGNTNFLRFLLLWLDLNPITFIYELDPYSLEIYRMSENELPTSRLSKVIIWQTYNMYIHTDRQTVYNAASPVVNKTQTYSSLTTWRRVRC